MTKGERRSSVKQGERREKMSRSSLLWCVKAEIMSYRPDLDQTLLRTDGGGWLRLPGWWGVATVARMGWRPWPEDRDNS